ncbi:MAG: type II toxin-antitoxin system PemK/MazF family toxin [Candidatus Zixiibacteriota bacterium]
MMFGDIVLLPFPFTDLTGSKMRPALVLAVSHNDVIVAFFTSNLHLDDEFSIKLEPNEINGLKLPSLLKLNKIATLEKSLVIGKLGEITDLSEIRTKLVKLFDLG